MATKEKSIIKSTKVAFPPCWSTSLHVVMSQKRNEKGNNELDFTESRGEKRKVETVLSYMLAISTKSSTLRLGYTLVSCGNFSNTLKES